ncbi:hypothetical protein MTO96_009178 [Rhipicephalus appendiculatus]
MSCSGDRANDELAPSRPELVTLNTDCLAVQEGVKASGEAVQLNSPREEGDKRTCCSPQRLSIWNKQLWGVKLEVRHTVREGLSLVSLEKRFRRNAQLRDATPLIRKLLTTHHCLTALDIDINNFRGAFAVDADWLTLISAAITTLANLKEVDCSTSCQCPVRFCVALAELLRTPTNLTALRIPALEMNGDGADILLTALAANSTLEELFFHATAISEARPEHRDSFAKFLANAETLKKLAVTDRAKGSLHSLKWVLQGLRWNTALTEVTFDDFFVDADCAELTAEVLACNHTIRKFKISLFLGDTWRSREGSTPTSRRAYYGKWLSPLARNETLQAVTLPLELWDPEQWEVLFESLSARASPLKLTINGMYGDSRQEYSWKDVCGAVQRSGIEEHVSFGTTLVITDGHEMLECKGFSKFYVFRDRHNLRKLSRLFRQLPSFTHVTVAHLAISRTWLDEEVSSDIGRYIATTSALKELYLWMWWRDHFPVAADAAIEVFWETIVESLRRNTSISELHVSAKYATKPEIQLLADTVNSSRNVRGAHVKIEAPQVAAVYVRRLHDGIERNHNLLRVSVDEYALKSSQLERRMVCHLGRNQAQLGPRCSSGTVR